MQKIRHIFYLLAVMIGMAACNDDLVVDSGNTPADNDKGIGQLVLFSSGSADNTYSRATTIPYMEQDGRFVCKMYYHAKATDTDADDFDTETTPIVSWLRVNDNEGNSVYWNRLFSDVNGDAKVDGNDLTAADREDANYRDYGFDPNAQFFYWRNRLDHVFLGYTDYHTLKTNTYGPAEPRKLFMYPEADGEKKTKTGETVSWNPVGYKQASFTTVSKPNPEYSEEEETKWKEEHPEDGPYPIPATISSVRYTGVIPNAGYPSLGLHFPLSRTTDYNDYINNKIVSYETIEKIRNQILAIIDATDLLSSEEKATVKTDIQRTSFTDEEIAADGTYRYGRWWVALNPDNLNTFNPDGTVNFSSETAVLYCEREKKQIDDIIAIAPANTFDLRRASTMTSMADQPDPLIALTKMKPTGATQEANRVRLYFKHQFSQIQVNLTNAENTAEITPENIVGVELLGVSEKGYVFTNINPDGTQILPSYDPVVISKYTEDQLKVNPYGTAFSMFDMGDAKPLTSLKSFNAIAFGQLQAIRITWKEEDYKNPETNEIETGVYHVATYKITVDDRNNSLVNLRSGFRYMYDFELRRGTIAFIRATIDDWLLDDELNYNTSGTINE